MEERGLYFSMAGRGDIPLIALHGNSVDSSVWENLLRCDAWMEKYKVLMVDLPGCGRSRNYFENEDDFNVDSITQAILANIPADFFAKQAPVIMGHSLGGHLGIALAEKLSAVSAILLLQCSPATDLQNLFSFFLPNPVAGLLFQGSLTDEEKGEIGHELCSPDTQYSSQIEKLFSGANTSFRSGFGKSMGIVGMKNEIEILKNLNCKKYLVLAQADKLLNTQLISDSLAQSVPDMQVLSMESKGHYAMFTDENFWSDLKLE
jgi:pimeloyl-ACP methyl ester carboxylesterase